MSITFNNILDKVRAGDFPAHSVCVNSQKVEKNSLFLSLPLLATATDCNTESKQLEYLYNSAKAGASYLICEENIAQKFKKQYPDYKELIIIVENVRKSLGKLANALYHTDKNTFPIIGITGTNGKTTLSYLIEYFFHTQMKKVGVLGTVSYRYNGYENDFNKNLVIDAPLTTPDCLYLHSFFHDMQKIACDFAIMEVSSHALDQERTAGFNFDCAIFTNLTQDHLDYHKNLKEYFQVKAKLFENVRLRIINADDEHGKKLLAKYPSAIAFTLHNIQVENPTLKGTILSSSPKGLELKLNYQEQEYSIKSPLIGQHNAANILALVGCALGYGYTLKDFTCLENFNGVSGRLERVENSENIHAFVDYAHTPDALINVLQALRGAGFEKIVTVFGCGGDRDKTKRPLMAQAVSKYSDVSILTSDNPRTEEPDAILDDVETGLDTDKEYHRFVDRKEAIIFAYNLIKNRDYKDKTALLIAGKGHEPYQIIGKTKFPFSDQEIIKEL